MAELSGVYRHVGAGGTVMRPTKEGPAMIFNNVKGHPGARVAIGVLASRKRVAALLGGRPEDLGKMLWHSVDNPIPPVLKEDQPPARRWCTGLMNQGLTLQSWCLRPLTHRMTRDLISLWECAMPAIRTQVSVM